MLLRHRRGERVWSVVHEPSPQAEDERRVHRELQRLTHEHTAHGNRIRALLVLHNLRPAQVGGRVWAAWWAAHQAKVPPLLRAEIERECQRLELVRQQMRAIEAQQRQELSHQPLVQQLSRLRAIGLCSAWVLTKELFGWRRFDNRRQVASSIGVVPTPYASGCSEREQGISKAGNKRVRWLLVELAWRWLRLQPESELTRWFNRRFTVPAASACAASASSRWRGGWPSRCGATCSTARSRRAPCSSRRRSEVPPCLAGRHTSLFKVDAPVVAPGPLCHSGRPQDGARR